jgi:NAD+-dependent protein deacetylase sirtuin 4
VTSTSTDPTPSTVLAPQLAALAALLSGRRVVALTGAGISTESGIPDYRGPETRRRARNPIQGRAFVESEALRRRYWARAAIGWHRFGRAAPNSAHTALAELEQAGSLAGVITQNVDRLHHRAGSRRVVELHGTLHEVRCLSCGLVEARASVQSRLLEANPGWLERSAELAPDGDADLDEPGLEHFIPPRCLDLDCGGALKPSVVFFGETVPRPVVDEAFALLAEAEALLVVGTSLAVYSGYRFVRAAAERRLPIALVNLGETRGAEHAAVHVEARAGDVLPKLAEALRSA